MPATLSIVMPSYNQARFLDEAIRSVLSQRAHVHQFFVLDGGSTDGSVDVIRRHASAIDHWRSGPDGGQSDAIADGFAMSTGTVLAWLNSDDALLPGAARAMLARFDADPGVGLVEGDTVVVDEHSRVLRCDRRAGPSARWMRFGYLRPHQPSVFFRRDLYERVGGVDRSLHCVMDTDLWRRMLPDARAQRLSRYVGVHRVHPDAKGVSWGDRYHAERAVMDQRHPRPRHFPLRYQLGRGAYLCARAVGRRAASSRRDTARFRGRPLAECFPDEPSTMTM